MKNKRRSYTQLMVILNAHLKVERWNMLNSYTVTDEELEEAVETIGKYPVLVDDIVGIWSTVGKEITKEVLTKTVSMALWKFVKRLEERHSKINRDAE